MTENAISFSVPYKSKIYLGAFPTGFYICMYTVG